MVAGVTKGMCGAEVTPELLMRSFPLEIIAGDFARRASLPDRSALCESSSPHRWRRRFLLDEHPLELPEITAIEKSADHVRRDLIGAERDGPGSIGTVHPLGNDALGAKLARMGEHGRPVIGDVFVEQDARFSIP